MEAQDKMILPPKPSFNFINLVREIKFFKIWPELMRQPNNLKIVANSLEMKTDYLTQ